jgi:predicted TIM-barrel fold metal-dependent hydrolase
MTDIDRRTFLASAVPLAMMARFAQPQPAPARGIIDLHHHFTPKAWLDYVKGRPLLQPTVASWTLQQSLEDMDRGGVSAAVLSITNPGLWFGQPADTRKLARVCNEEGAEIVRAHPTRFGLFAALPMPDVTATLAEIAYAYDSLKADGVGLFTNYGDKWLGHPDFSPVMAELNRRKAVIAVHPTAADCCRSLNYAPGVGPGTLEYGTDTTRAIMGVTFSGDAVRFPDIRFIWSHAGGTAPFLAARIEGASASAKDALPNGFIAEAKKFYYDVAGAANRGALISLQQLVGPSQIVFGTDFPPGAKSAVVAKALTDSGLFNDADRRALDRDNAIRLIPRLGRL